MAELNDVVKLRQVISEDSGLRIEFYGALVAILRGYGHSLGSDLIGRIVLATKAELGSTAGVDPPSADPPSVDPPTP